MVYSDVRSCVVLLYSCGCLACGWCSAGVGGVGCELSAGSVAGVGWDGACRSVLPPGVFCCVCWFGSVCWVVLGVVVAVVVGVCLSCVVGGLVVCSLVGRVGQVWSALVVFGCQRVADDASVREVGTVPSE